ncbi:hypothetical protein AB0B15_38440 [Streptomyces sp. NPDC045456]|uniref:hypothetical protein n=1 Tax=Streptomyces sp. NPDC045456 TaxID=3155254 RepID=UPI003406D001
MTGAPVAFRREDAERFMTGKVQSGKTPVVVALRASLDACGIQYDETDEGFVICRDEIRE